MIIIAFILYAITLLSIGAYSYSHMSKKSDFTVGGRGLGYIVTAISAHASDMSSWLFFGFPAAIYVSGLKECWAALGLLSGMWATWHFVAPRIRARTERTRSTTLSHFFSAATNDTSGLVSLVSALASLFFFLFYIASGLKGVSTLLNATFGLPHLTGILIAQLVIVTYTMLGGYAAVALTDTFQGIFLLAMIILVPVATFFHLPAAATLPSLSLSYAPASLHAGLITALSWGIGYCGMPHVLTKFMGIDSVKNMKKAQYVGLTWQTMALGASLSIGLLARSYFVTRLANPEHIFITLVGNLFSPLFAGFILCAVLAATVSTLDAQVIVSATVLSHDVFSFSSPQKKIWGMRASIVAITAIAGILAWHSPQSLYEIVRYAWSGLGSTFGPLVLATLFSSRVSPVGAIVGMLTGSFVAAVWPFTASILTNAPMIPGFVLGGVSIWIASILFPQIKNSHAR